MSELGEGKRINLFSCYMLSRNESLLFLDLGEGAKIFPFLKSFADLIVQHPKREEKNIVRKKEKEEQFYLVLVTYKFVKCNNERLYVLEK